MEPAAAPDERPAPDSKPAKRPPVAVVITSLARVMVENMMARDAEEGISAFLEKRKPEWTGR